MLPTLNDLFLPLLRICKDGKEYHEIKLAEIISDQLKLTEEERNRVISSGTRTIVNRIQWAVFELKCANLVTRMNRIVKITSDGLKILQNNPTKIELKSIPAYQEYYEQVEKRKQDTKQDTTEEQTPDDIIRIGHDNLKQVIKTELLESIKNNTPNFFEHLVQDLLKKMGYGIESKVIGKTGDGGIDGIIKEDKLGLSEIYFQAKRYRGTVPIHHIRDFAGAISTRKSKKGIFIASSNFSKDADDFVSSTDAKIILIDGHQLAEYMYDYNLGVNIKETYHIKTIDEDYFSIL